MVRGPFETGLWHGWTLARRRCPSESGLAKVHREQPSEPGAGTAPFVYPNRSSISDRPSEHHHDHI
jgi:hypothetical protein